MQCQQEPQVCMPEPELQQCTAEGTEFGSNSVRGAQVQGSDLTDRSTQIEGATQDMGEVSGMDDGFYSSAGGVLDVLLPNVGDKGKVQINVNIPIDQSGSVRVSFEFVAEAERDANGVKGKIQVGGGVTATTTVDLYFVAVDAFARGMVFGYMESYGDSSTEMFRLMGLGIQQRLAGASQDIADAVFDRAYISATMREMDSDDYVESGLGVAVSAGASVRTGAPGTEPAASAGGGVTYQEGTRLTSDGRGGVRENDAAQLQVQLNGQASPFALAGKITGKWLNDELGGVDVEVEGEAMLGADELSEVVVGGRWLSGMMGSLISIIQGGQGLVQDENVARQVGGMASFIGQSSGIGQLAEGASARAIDNLSGMGVSLGHKLTVKVSWTAGQGYGLEITLERVGQIEFSTNPRNPTPRDTVYVLVENVQRVFQITV